MEEQRAPATATAVQLDAGQTSHFVACHSRNGTTTITITGKRGTVPYAGALIIASHTGLPHTFRSTVHQGSRLVLTETGSFTYGDSYVIRLPKGGKWWRDYVYPPNRKTPAMDHFAGNSARKLLRY